MELISLEVGNPILKEYYQNDNIDKFAWIKDPFNATAPSEFTAAEEDNLIELSCDNMLKTKLTPWN
jgi:hypothetical protein